ncbi:hypothetical protein Tchar_00914 [Tepidimonas charontis]|jgi:hypothetical protein|uniref:Uncharacterized protein n=1 Tax=Tepidimonas charontis TaxID=2267262 RepID=A0A554XH19_9BURK|nr:hypothetical protein Tchar_00914 [Tepidimonas charontis]
MFDTIIEFLMSEIDDIVAKTIIYAGSPLLAWIAFKIFG